MATIEVGVMNDKRAQIDGGRDSGREGVRREEIGIIGEVARGTSRAKVLGGKVVMKEKKKGGT